MRAAPRSIQASSGSDAVVCAISAFKEDGGGTDAGAVYIFYGGSALSGSASLSSAAIKLEGEVDDSAGISVDGIGDFDGDGQPDIAVGAYTSDDIGTNSGRVYVVLGGRSGGTHSLGSAEVRYIGEATLNNAGGEVSGGGDYNGDGFSDLFIGAAFNEDGGATRSGSAYLVLGGGY